MCDYMGRVPGQWHTGPPPTLLNAWEQVLGAYIRSRQFAEQMNRLQAQEARCALYRLCCSHLPCNIHGVVLFSLYKLVPIFLYYFMDDGRFYRTNSVPCAYFLLWTSCVLAFFLVELSAPVLCHG